MRFESQANLIRETEAIDAFISIFGGSAEKLGPNDVDFRYVSDAEAKTWGAYIEVKGRHRTIQDAYPLPVM